MFNPFTKLNGKLRWFSQRWQVKNPKEKWFAISKFARIIHELVGVRLFSDRKNYWYTATPGICGAMYFLLNTYTIQYYLFRKEYVQLIECTYLVGPVVAVSSK